MPNRFHHAAAIVLAALSPWGCSAQTADGGEPVSPPLAAVESPTRTRLWLNLTVFAKAPETIPAGDQTDLDNV